MTPQTALDLIIEPTLRFLGPKYSTPEACAMLLAIGLQESGFKTRIQVKGPARGFWQFESGGGAAEFATSPKLEFFRFWAGELQHPTDPASTMLRIGVYGNDTLACIMARSILWLEPHPLPKPGDVEGAWRQYLARWRPGKPDRTRWSRCYADAASLVWGA